MDTGEMDWQSMLGRLVKDLTVADQIVITVLTTLLTYALIFGLNFMLIREGRRKDKASRAAEAVKVIALRRDDIFNQILEKLGEASVEVYRILTETGQKDKDGTVAEPSYDLRAVIAKLEESVAISTKLGSLAILQTSEFEQRAFDITYANFYYDLIDEIHLEQLPNRRETVKKLIGVVQELKLVIQEAAAFEGRLSTVQFIHASEKRLPRRELNFCRQLSSRLHAKEEWLPMNWWQYVRRDYSPRIAEVLPEPPLDVEDDLP